MGQRAPGGEAVGLGEHGAQEVGALQEPLHQDVSVPPRDAPHRLRGRFVRGVAPPGSASRSMSTERSRAAASISSRRSDQHGLGESRCAGLAREPPGWCRPPPAPPRTAPARPFAPARGSERSCSWILLRGSIPRTPGDKIKAGWLRLLRNPVEGLHPQCRTRTQVVEEEPVRLSTL